MIFLMHCIFYTRFQEDAARFFFRLVVQEVIGPFALASDTSYFLTFLFIFFFGFEKNLNRLLQLCITAQSGPMR